MPDRSIPYKNIFMRCDKAPREAPLLPAGFSFRPYDAACAEGWAEMEYAVGDFASKAEARAYFDGKYAAAPAELQKRCVFVVDAAGAAAASAIAWWDKMAGKTVASLHWVVAHPDRQGLGLGRAALLAALWIFEGQSAYPVYLHTQPWSYKAIIMYDKYGFRLLKTAAFEGKRNEYAEAVETLRPLIGDKALARLAARAE